MQLSLHNVYLIYKLPLICCHYWNNIYITKVVDLIFNLVDYLDKCRKMNRIRFFHLANIPLFCIYVYYKQNNTLKHSFNNLFIYTFLLFPPSVGIFKNIYDYMSINNNYFSPYPNINCVLFLLLGIEKLHQLFMAWCFPTHIILPILSWRPISFLQLPFSLTR